MKKKILFGFLMLSILAFTLCQAAAVRDPGESIKSSEMPKDGFVYNFGEVQEGETLKHSFTLKNETDQPMLINDITTSCGCTVSRVQKKDLAPGEGTSLEVTFSSEGYSGETTQYVYVHTSSIDNPIFRFIIKADVRKK
jgi:hypothetical protein